MRAVRHSKPSIYAMLLLVLLMIAAACTQGADEVEGESADVADVDAPEGTDRAEETEALDEPTEADSATEDTPAELIPVRYGLPTSTYFLTTVSGQFSLQNGFFEEEGLDVEITPLPGSTTAIRSLLSGDQDIVLTGGDTAFLAWQNGAPIKIIDSPMAKGTDVMIARSEFETVEDLEGTRFAISDPGSTAEILGRIVLERNGVDPDSVQFVALGSPADRIRALLNGQVDATAATILTLQPVLDAVEAGEVNILTPFAEEFPNIPLSYNVTTDNMIAENPDVIERFLRAEIRGLRWAEENPEEAAAIAVEFIDETPQELLEQAFEGLTELGVFGVDGGITEEGIIATQEALVELGQLSEASEPSDVANFELVEQAVNELES